MTKFTPIFNGIDLKKCPSASPMDRAFAEVVKNVRAF
ncbi:hypothetical protein J2X97_001969 [Epilithonimonas hungarica]|nr:hypothetical protein [Epilithonimonas hungarica]